MNELLIIGARGFGREVYFAAIESLGFKKDYIVKGFLDDKADALADFPGYPPIIDSVEKYTPKENDVFICALGDVSQKAKYSKIILDKGGTFTNIIHKEAYISPNSRLGKGCIVLARTRISCDIKVGDFVTFQPFGMIGHDCRIGDNCHLNSHIFLGGGVTIENNVTIHTGAIIHPHKKVGEGATVGAGSFVGRNVKPHTTVFGMPAMEI